MSKSGPLHVLQSQNLSPDVKQRATVNNDKDNKRKNERNEQTYSLKEAERRFTCSYMKGGRTGDTNDRQGGDPKTREEMFHYM